VRIGSLFSGVGGLELGLEWAAVGHTVWQVEVDPFCRSVLAKHWPDALRFDDVHSVGAHNLPPADVICGGFPCPPFSSANVVTRSDGTHGLDLWREMGRIVGELRPAVVVVENVASGWRQWLPSVRRDLWRLGYASVPVQVSAADAGAPFDGARVFVVATSDRERQPTLCVDGEVAELPQPTDARRAHWRAAPPGALGVADGIPCTMERNQALGNAVVPACAEVIGRRILSMSDR
jgi:DNA (cytosine-5)-methyltransferase 1